MIYLVLVRTAQRMSSKKFLPPLMVQVEGVRGCGPEFPHVQTFFLHGVWIFLIDFGSCRKYFVSDLCLKQDVASYSINAVVDDGLTDNK